MLRNRPVFIHRDDMTKMGRAMLNGNKARKFRALDEYLSGFDDNKGGVGNSS